MRLIDEYVDPRELTGYVRAALADYEVNQFILSQWLPSRNVDDLQYRFRAGQGGLTNAAEYRVWDAEAPIGSRPGTVRKSGELPPISRKIRLSEYDRLRRDRLDGAIRTDLMDDGARMALEIAARVELARAEALRLGTVTLNENGVKAGVDYGRVAGMSVTAATAWTDLANATVLSNLLAWHQAYIDQNGQPAAVILMPSAQAANVARNAEMKQTASSAAFQPGRLRASDVQGVLGDYELPPIRTFDAQVLVNNSATRLLPANEVLFLPAGGADFGETQWGTTAEALEYGFTAEREGIVSGVYKDEDPVALWTKDAAIVLPVVYNPNLTMRAVVSA